MNALGDIRSMERVSGIHTLGIQTFQSIGLVKCCRNPYLLAPQVEPRSPESDEESHTLAPT